MDPKFSIQIKKKIVVNVSIKCIAANSDGIFVVGGQNKDLEVYDSEGKLKKAFSTDYDISSITAQPNSIYVSSRGVSDSSKAQIKVYNCAGELKKDVSLSFLTWAREGVVDKFYSLQDRGLYITSTPNNTIYMTSVNTNVLYTCDAPQTNLRQVSQLEFLSRPSHICYGPNEKLYIYFREHDKVSVFLNGSHYKDRSYALKGKVLDISCGGSKRIYILTNDGMIHVIDEDCLDPRILDLRKHGISDPSVIAVNKDEKLYVGHAGTYVSIFEIKISESNPSEF